MWRRYPVVAFACVVLVGVLAGAISTSALLRGRLVAAAKSGGFDATIGRASLGWFSISLSDVTLRPFGVPVEVSIHDVRAELSWKLRPTRVDAHRAEVRVNGTPSVVESSVRGWRRSRRRRWKPE